MMMKFTRSWVVLAGLSAVGALLSGGAWAQQQKSPAAAPAPVIRPLPPKGSQFVFIDQGEIETGASAFRGLLTERDKMATGLQAEINRMEKDLRTADEELNKQRAVLSPDAYTQRRRDLDKRFSDAQTTVNNRKRDIDQAVGDAYNKVMKQVFDIVAEIVRENDYKVVLERKVVVVAESSLDISGEVVSRLNKKMPSVAVAVPK
ncbi:MAG TPA: OmpH family outer membrane protein [Alphaproteobacteria bacterium]|nr:OmpH family outer membrane protein [Alphaproteobacteria bacterium]